METGGDFGSQQGLAGKWLWIFSVILVPLALTAMFIWTGGFLWKDPTRPAASLEIKAAAEPKGGWSLVQAARALEAAAPERRFATKRSEEAFWFRPVAAPGAQGAIAGSFAIEFPSRHARDFTCWNARTGAEIGQAGRSSTLGAVQESGAGFWLPIPQGASPGDVVCRGRFAGPAQISADLWERDRIEGKNLSFWRDGGMLDGALGVLCVAALLVAVGQRDWRFVLFFAWLALNWRMAALSGGWDGQFMGIDLPEGALSPMRAVVTAGYYTMTIALFSTLLREEIGRMRMRIVVEATKWSTLPVLMASILLPFAAYLPIVWVCTAIGSAVILGFAGRALIKMRRDSRSKVALWFGASVAITLAGALSEIASAAMGRPLALAAFNHMSAAIAASLLAAIALARKMKEERDERDAAKRGEQLAYERSPVGLFTLDAEGRLRRANPKMREMLGELAVPGAKAELSWPKRFGDQSWDMFQAELNDKPEAELKILANRGLDMKGDKPIWLQVTARRSGEEIEGSVQDITEKEEATGRLRFLSERDSLTEALNRRGFEARLTQMIEDGAASERIGAVVVIDLERFKLVNDLHGRSCGDDALREAARRIAATRGSARVDAEVGRLGGDEFVALLPRVSLEEAQDWARSALWALREEPFELGERREKEFRLSASAGVVELGRSMSPGEALSMADQACREASKQGAEVVGYGRSDRAWESRKQERAVLERLASGRAPDGLELVAQPILSLADPFRTLGFEALIRMRRPDGTLAGAGEVIGPAEASGRIALVDRWTLATLTRWIEENWEEVERARFICVNISGGSVNDDRFQRDAFSLLRGNQRAASKLCLEITESVALRDVNATLRFVEKAKEFGAKVALDDFGAGHSSFPYLKSLPAEVIKIDGNLVRDAARSPASLAIVESIAGLAGSLGMRTIAEWTEDAQAVKEMARIGVDYAQGYAVARPMPIEKILGAKCSADFVQDPELLSFLKLTDGGLAPASLGGGRMLH